MAVPFEQDEIAKIDHAHADLLRSLIVAHKPRTILELGLGGGKSADAILNGLEYNQQPYTYTLVDNWQDRGGVIPEVVIERYAHRLNMVTSGEQEFVFACQEQYEFIMSDADHFRADQWFEYVYNNLVADGGILIYHDVNLIEHDFDNLRNIYYKCKEYNLRYVLFNRNSLPAERCHRGLLVIFKPEA
jgi:predicted O-methyltransferase YrrM